MSNVELNAARTASGLRAIADGLAVNPDLSVAQKVIRDAATKIEELERERDEAREKYDIPATEHMLVVNKLCIERDEAREQNAKMRYIAERAVEVASMVSELYQQGYRPESLDQLRAELDQLKEGGK